MSRYWIIGGIAILALLTIILVINPRSASFNPSPSPNIPTSTQLLDTVNSFYQDYQSCLNSPPQQALGQVSTWCQANNPYISTEFVKNLNAGGVAQAGADPILCAQNTPQSIKATQAFPPATVSVYADFGTPATSQTITVNLVEENSLLKINNIICPTP